MRQNPQRQGSLFDLKIVAAAGIAFILILLLQNYEAQQRLTAQISTQRADIVSRAEKIVDSLMDERTQRLTNFTELLAGTQQIAHLMLQPKHSGRDLEDMASQFIINSDANEVYFLGVEGASLLGTQPPAEVYTLATRSMSNKKPDALVSCSMDICTHYIAIPVLADGVDAGAIVTAFDLRVIFRSFSQATGAKITITKCGPSPMNRAQKGLYETEFRDMSKQLPPGYCFKATFNTTNEDAIMERMRQESVWGSVLAMIILAFILLFIYLYNLKLHQQIVETEKSERKKKAETLERVSRSIENERKILAAELHDELGQRLVPVRFNATILHSMAEERGYKDLAEIASSIEDGISSMSKGVSAMINSLRPPLLDTLGLRGSIESVIDEFTFAMPRCNVSFNCDENLALENINDPVQVAIYRVIQESLTNITKHAPSATKVGIGISCEEDGLHVSISDNGPGTQNMGESGGGIGLRGMRERAFAMNGRLLVGPAPGGGCSIVMILPCVNKICSMPCARHQVKLS